VTDRPLLSVADLEAGYGGSRVLFGVSLDVGEGEVVTLLGRNGMGKTTTILAIMGIVASTGGRISFAGSALTGLASFRIARHGIGLVPEGRQIFPNLTVRENLVATAAVRPGEAAAWTIERVLDLFPPLRERMDSPGNLLSGGEQQMLAIGRAMMTNPKLLILDEATEGLAPLIRKQIWQVLNRIKSSGVSILIVDKNVEALTRIATRHYILERGRTVWTGSSDELRRDSTLKGRYLGV
jgi:branched-chain amino acid transport system ATP-binding protein